MSASQDSYARREIEKPLGLDRRPPSPRRRWIDPGRLGAAALCLGVLGVSSAIALRERPFRVPLEVVTTTPEEVAAAASTGPSPSAGYPQGAATGSGGPSIIKVTPDADAAQRIVVRDPTALTQDARTAHLPDRALIEDSEHGPLPVRAADGRRPFDVYARPWSGARGARVAIVIGGLGVSQTGTQAAIAQLPDEITLAFASGGNSLDRWMQTARQEGHEIIMQVPLEPFDYPRVDPGRNTLTVDADPEENRDRLYWALSRITNYTGIMNYMGARFVTDEAAMNPLFGELSKRGLMYVDDGSSARTLSAGMAEANRVPFAGVDMTIDTERDRGAILAKLDDLERTARAKGFAVGAGSAFDTTIAAVTTWVQEARRRGIEIVPISAIARDPERD